LRRAALLALLSVLCWTTGPVGSKAALLARHGEARLTPLQVAFWAILLGWAALALRLLLGGGGRRLRGISPRGWAVIAAMGLFGWTGYPVAINFAYTRLPLAEAMLISYLNPVLVVLLQGAWLGRLVRPVSGWEQEAGRKPTPGLRVALGLALCLGGVAAIATNGRLSTLLGFRFSVGVGAALFAALAWAVYSNLGRFVAVRPGHDAGGLAAAQNLGAMTIGLAVMAALLVGAGEWRPPAGFATVLYWGGIPLVSVDTWLIIAAMGLLNYAVGYTLWLHSLELGARAGEAHRLPPITYLLVVLSVLIGWLLLREPIRPIFWIGAALIAAGNAVTLWPAHREVAAATAR